MGIPANYSVELPRRCLQLLNELGPRAEQIRQTDRPDLGPLTATFLLALSMPIISVPIERLQSIRAGRPEAFSSDRGSSKSATNAFDEIEKKQFSETPFFQKSAWSFAIDKSNPPINLSHGLPDLLVTELADVAAFQHAADMPTQQFLAVLRNALAHAGIAYLDGHGRSSWGTGVEHFAFASERRDKTIGFDGINILRVSMKNYRIFLASWVRWLQDSGAAQAIQAA